MPHREALAERLFVTPVEVAELLEMDPRTVRAALQRGEIPGFKVGAWWRIPAAWLRSQAGIGGDDAATA
jgi:excisionase family DNA binding protein